jgi:hypothetical protein
MDTEFLPNLRSQQVAVLETPGAGITLNMKVDPTCFGRPFGTGQEALLVGTEIAGPTLRQTDRAQPKDDPSPETHDSTVRCGLPPRQEGIISRRRMIEGQVICISII